MAPVAPEVPGCVPGEEDALGCRHHTGVVRVCQKDLFTLHASRVPVKMGEDLLIDVVVLNGVAELRPEVAERGHLRTRRVNSPAGGIWENNTRGPLPSVATKIQSSWLGPLVPLRHTQRFGTRARTALPTSLSRNTARPEGQTSTRSYPAW